MPSCRTRDGSDQSVVAITAETLGGSCVAVLAAGGKGGSVWMTMSISCCRSISCAGAVAWLGDPRHVYMALGLSHMPFKPEWHDLLV